MASRNLVLLWKVFKLSAVISVLRAFVPITDMVEIAISATDPITDPIISTSVTSIQVYPLHIGFLLFN